MKLKLVVLILWIVGGCKDIVDVNDLEPSPEVFCSMPEWMEGTWVSDSAHITTHVDTLDSAIFNPSPTLTYFLEASCSSDTNFVLRYVTYVGDETKQFRSTNYIVSDTAVFLFAPFDEERDLAKAAQVISYSLEKTDTLSLFFSEQLTEGHLTETKVYLHRN